MTRRRQETPTVLAKPRGSATKPVLVPYYDPELGGHVLYEHQNSVPLRLKAKEVDSYGNVRWEVVYPKAPLSNRSVAADAVQAGEGDEKRIKVLQPMPGWDLTRMTTHFSWMVILVLDDRPYGLGFRCGEREFHTPYHMGPINGKKLEICGIQDYEENLDECTRARLDPSNVTITALDYADVRSKTGFDQILVEAGIVPFSKAGISIYPHGYDKGVQGEVLSLGFDMASAGIWKPLVVHRGELCHTPCFTAGTGTVLHTVNTEAGWSGAPLVRMNGGKAAITAVHIAGVPGPAQYNVAISANMVEKMVRAKDSTYVPTWNCPFNDMVLKVDGESEEVLYLTDEKSTRRGAPKQNRRKGPAGWSQQHVKAKGNRNVAASRMSSATYDKPKQAASLVSGNPQQAEAVKATYGKLMRLQAEIERLRLNDDDDGREELERLEKAQEEEEEEEEEEMDTEGFYRDGDECLHCPGIIWEKKWSEHDPDAEFAACGNEARGNNPDSVFSTKVQGNEPWIAHMSPGDKKNVIKKLMAIPISVEGFEKRHIIGAYGDRKTSSTGDVDSTLSDEYVYLTRMIAAQRTRTVAVSFENKIHRFQCTPLNPGDVTDMVVVHTCDEFVPEDELLPPLQVTPGAAECWADAWGLKYGGDTGGSEKRSDVANGGDQKRVYDQFYRDTMTDSVEAIKPHRKLVTEMEPKEVVVEALDRYFSPEGKISDLEPILNCDPQLIWDRKEAEDFKFYCRAGGYAWCEKPGEVIPESGGNPCFSVVGYCSKLPGKSGLKEYTKVTRKVRKCVGNLVRGGVSEDAKQALLDSLSLSFVMPPTDEQAMIKSLRGQAQKQTTARPTMRVRALLKQIAKGFREQYPPTSWSPTEHSVGAILDHHLTVADDKAIGWSAYVFPGTRGGIQKDPAKKDRVILLAKVRLALRYAWAGSLHGLSPREMVSEGLMDPAVNFIKGEGHPPRKIKTETWRLIWNLSEVDRLLDCLVFTDQDKADIMSFQDGPRTEENKFVGPAGRPYALAVGVGHDDNSLQRTYAEMEALKAVSPDGKIRASDASGWDLSVSAATFWCAMECRLCRAESIDHYRALLINGFFQCSWVVSTGNTLWESNRFGITGSGSGVTTSKNSQERSMGSKFGQISKELGGLAAIPSAPPTLLVIPSPSNSMRLTPEISHRA